MSADKHMILKKTGTLHLIAISGLHIGLLIKCMQFFLHRVFARGVFKKIYAKLFLDIFAVIIAYLYVLIAGSSLSAERACLMALIIIIGQGLFVRAASWLSCCLAFYLITFLDPSSLTNPGFWLSFSGVGVLLFNINNVLESYVVMFVVMSIVSAWFFNAVAFSAVIANVIAIPFFELWIVPLSLLGIVSVSFSQHFAIGCWSLAQSGVNILWPFLTFLSKHGYFWLSYIPKLYWFLAMFGLLIFLFVSFWRFSSWCILWCLPLFCSHHPHNVALGHFLVTVLDVGQGLAVVVQTHKHLLLYDAGPRYKHWDAGDRVILPYIHWLSYKSIDKMIISHGDLDHRGGANYLYKNIKISEIISSEPRRLLIPSKECIAGQHWRWDGVDFAVLSPPYASSWHGNQRSCVLLIKNHIGSVLLPGDINVQAENWLLDHYNLHLQGLIVPHHGSKTSSSLNFLIKTQPKWAIISSGSHNRFGLPNAKVVKRYKNQGVNLKDTQSSGSISYLT
jgi:competence protein ComEC